MSTWVRNDRDRNQLDPNWFDRGIPPLESDSGGLFIREYLNLDTGAMVILLPNADWKHARQTGHGEYQAWLIPPGPSTAVPWTVWTGEARAQHTFGGQNAHSLWHSAFTAMTEAIERQLRITAPTELD